jgi:hypothetical protein
LRDDEVEQTGAKRRRDQEHQPGEGTDPDSSFQPVKRTIVPKNHPEQTKSENAYENLTGVIDSDDHEQPNDEAFNTTQRFDDLPDLRA